MRLTKFGHCCFLIEDQGVRILTDPGNFTSQQDKVINLDAVVISHEHADHVHVESLSRVMANNPQALIITNSAVKNLLADHDFQIKVVEEGQNIRIKDMLIEAFGDKHAEIYSQLNIVQSTGYFFNNKFFLPGDSFNNPGKAVDVLGLPMAAPWLKISEVLDYAIEVKPRVVIPVHDGYLKAFAPQYKLVPMFLEPVAIEFKNLELNQVYEL
jgi:L-ascorbate metabolism protein UlaG (beta-lactamase superfamily)